MARERVVEVVGDARRQVAHRLAPLRMLELLRQGVFLRDVEDDAIPDEALEPELGDGAKAHTTTVVEPGDRLPCLLLRKRTLHRGPGRLAIFGMHHVDEPLGFGSGQLRVDAEDLFDVAAHEASFQGAVGPLCDLEQHPGDRLGQTLETGSALLQRAEGASLAAHIAESGDHRPLGAVLDGVGADAKPGPLAIGPLHPEQLASHDLTRRERALGWDALHGQGHAVAVLEPPARIDGDPFLQLVGRQPEDLLRSGIDRANAPVVLVHDQPFLYAFEDGPVELFFHRQLLLRELESRLGRLELALYLGQALGLFSHREAKLLSGVEEKLLLGDLRGDVANGEDCAAALAGGIGDGLGIDEEPHPLRGGLVLYAEHPVTNRPPHRQGQTARALVRPDRRPVGGDDVPRVSARAALEQFVTVATEDVERGLVGEDDLALGIFDHHPDVDTVEERSKRWLGEQLEECSTRHDDACPPERRIGPPANPTMEKEGNPCAPLGWVSPPWVEGSTPRCEGMPIGSACTPAWAAPVSR